MAADPNKPWRSTESTPPSATAIGVVVPIDEEKIDGDQVLRGDMVCYTRLPTGTPGPFKYVMMTDSLDGNTWNIVSASPLAPGPVVLLYELHLRQ